MKILLIKIIKPLFLAGLLFLACMHVQKPEGKAFRISLSIREGINISHEEALQIFNKYLKDTPGSQNSIEIKIFSYSSGKETFFYSKETEKDTIQRNTYRGSISALLKIKIDERLVSAKFVNTRGGSKPELIEKIAIKIKKIVKE